MEDTTAAEEMITVSKSDIATYIDGMSKIRATFIVCAPRFASGSFGDAAVVAAQQLAPIEVKLANLLLNDSKK